MPVISEKDLDELLTDEGLAKLKKESDAELSPEWLKKYGDESWKTMLVVSGITSPRDDVETK